MDPRKVIMAPQSTAIPPPERTLEPRETAAAAPRKPFVYRPPGELPETIKNHPDWTARWVRFRMSQGQSDPTNISKKMRDGFRFVPFEQRSEVLTDPDSVMQTAGSGNVEIGDVVLMRRPRYISAARSEYYAQVTRDQIRGAKNEVKKAEIPGKNYGSLSDDSTTSFATPKGKEVAFGDE